MKKITVDLNVLVMGAVLIVVLFGLLIHTKVQQKDTDSQQTTAAKTHTPKISTETDRWCNPYSGSCVDYPDNATIKPGNNTGVTFPLDGDHPSVGISFADVGIGFTTVPNGSIYEAECPSGNACTFKTVRIDDTQIKGVKAVCGVKDRGNQGIEPMCFAVSETELQQLGLVVGQTTPTDSFNPMYESPASKAGKEKLGGRYSTDKKLTAQQAEEWLQTGAGSSLGKVVRSLSVGPDVY